MRVLAGYVLGEQLHESGRSIVYRARCEGDGAPVVVKALRNEQPLPHELKRFQQEYELLRTVSSEGVIRPYALERYKNRLVLVTEDYGAEALSSFLRNRRLEVGQILEIAVQLAGSLGDIHRHNIIHKDINPANILIHPVTKQVKVIDFGIATALPRECLTVRNPNVLEGTLRYLSPEQTGRMNRALDYRTDFYSLGVTLYEMLTGRLPFLSEDPLELVHLHIAGEPIAPAELASEVPKALSDIVLKLLSKTAEDRYRSAYGLQADLTECLAQWRAAKRIEVFIPGLRDVVDKFQIPQKLYGREREIAALLETFERVSRGHIELLLVAGYSGVGKSALVNEIQRPISRRHGYFITGKFDQLQRDIPYMPLIQAFQGLVRQLLTENEARLTAIRKRLLEALGPNGHHRGHSRD